MLVRKHSFSTMEVKKYMKSMNPSLMRKKALVPPQTMDQTNTVFLIGLSLITSHQRRIPVMNVSSSGI